MEIPHPPCIAFSFINKIVSGLFFVLNKEWENSAIEKAYCIELAGCTRGQQKGELAFRLVTIS